MADNPLVGTWRLVSYCLRGSRDRVRYPYGEDARGYIIYSPDGYMAVSIMSAHRLPFAGVDILRRTTEEAAAATRTYLSYCGTYEILPDRVVHHVELSLFPNWTGTRQERFYTIEALPSGWRLELSTVPIPPPSPPPPRAYLIWERTVEEDGRGLP
ncbi:MAG TPA: lipocalin-like domain-containing protein [Chloroflexota bacterium]|nr:lipocalin-like domain-containing protein [Chloroflexota bacterium]